jgi:hypothetical protein
VWDDNKRRSGSAVCDNRYPDAKNPGRADVRRLTLPAAQSDDHCAGSNGERNDANPQLAHDRMVERAGV